MVFDEDTLLLSFFSRYTLPDEADDLKKDVLKYIGAGVAEPQPTVEQSTNDGSTEAMSSPLDSAFDMKKRRRLA